tara:strand:- start:298 stop:717 length:420 start_codon:yes stop_codon:yes gene_type:complete
MAKTKLTGTFEDIIEGIDSLKEDAIREMLTQAIDFLVLESPVDTGAYIESHTLSNTAGAPRSRSARGRKRGSGNPAIAKEQLLSDLSKLDLTKDIFNIRNNSPHASIVENNPRQNISKSHVYQRLANVLGNATVDTGTE